MRKQAVVNAASSNELPRPSVTMLQGEKPRVQSAARVVDILRLVAEADSNGISATDLSEKLEIPRQVVYHLAHTLSATQMLRKIGRGTYVLGVGMAPLMQGFKRQMSADHLATYCRQAAVETGETAYVSGWVNDEVVVLATARGRAAVQAAEVPIGTSGDAHARASGKLLLAMSSDADVQRYITGHPMKARTPHTRNTHAKLLAALNEIRKDWVSTDEEEYALGLSCMAVPIPSAPSQFALCISVPSYRFEENRTRYAKILKRIARGSAESEMSA
jgi:IclR family transcriptional regulator, acetate operon repressor